MKTRNKEGRCGTFWYSQKYCTAINLGDSSQAFLLLLHHCNVALVTGRPRYSVLYEGSGGS